MMIFIEPITAWWGWAGGGGGGWGGGFCFFGDQHDEMAWLTKKDLLEKEDVHPFCKSYFIPNANNGFWQVRVL